MAAMVTLQPRTALGVASLLSRAFAELSQENNQAIDFLRRKGLPPARHEFRFLDGVAPFGDREPESSVLATPYHNPIRKTRVAISTRGAKLVLRQAFGIREDRPVEDRQVQCRTC